MTSRERASDDLDHRSGHRRVADHSGADRVIVNFTGAEMKTLLITCAAAMLLATSAKATSIDPNFIPKQTGACTGLPTVVRWMNRRLDAPNPAPVM